MRFLVFCPKCKNNQLYECNVTPFRKIKKCVFCGENFTILGMKKNKKISRIVKKISD